MRRIVREVAHDLKEPGIHIWMIPLVALTFIVMTYFVQKSLDAAGRQNLLTLPLLEALVPSLGGYGALMLMQGLLDTEGGELAFTYPRTRLYWGLIRQLRFFVLYALLIVVVCKSVAGIMRIDFAPVFYLTLAQSFAVMAVSFFGVTLGKKVSIGLIVLVAFVGIQIMIGREFEILNRIYVIAGTAPSQEQLDMIVYNSLFIGAFGWGIGQVWLRP
jgi:hypothetical protein